MAKTRRSNFCRSCGELVYWFKKSDGTTHRPLEEKAFGLWVNEDGVVQSTSMTIYDYHSCNSEKVEEFKDEAARRAKLQQEYNEARSIAQKEGLQKPCPRDYCKAKIGEACINITMAKKGIIRKIMWPHSERLTNAKSS